MKTMLWPAVLSLCLAGSCRPAAQSDDTPAPVAVTARVESVSAAVAWDHYEDGSFAARDAITFAILSPARLADRRITVYVEPEQLPADSALRDVGSRCAFSIDPATLEADEVHWGALEGIRVSDPDPDA